MSMSEVIEQMKRESVEIGATDRQKRYPGVCPQCGKELYICKSMLYGATLTKWKV